MYSFEDKLSEIDELLKKSSSQWKLDGIQWMDYDDVSQIIRVHVHTKWSLWDQTRPFQPWCKQVISNQIRNLIRNHYSSFCRPCNNCPHNNGNDSCALTKSKLQDTSCADYKKWFKKKSHLFNIKIPLSLDNQVIDIAILGQEIDFLKSSETLHTLILSELTNERQKRVYTMLYIEGLEDADVAKEMGFVADDKGASRYKQINNLKAKFLEIAKSVMERNDVV